MSWNGVIVRAAFGSNRHVSNPLCNKRKKMRKGDFFNMQQMVCNDLGLIAKGIFRIYFRHPDTSEDKNIFFF